jgi:hypothetical protein
MSAGDDADKSDVRCHVGIGAVTLPAMSRWHGRLTI